MSAPQPDPIMRAVAEVVVNEEKVRAAADRELTAEIERLRELIDALGNNSVPPELADRLMRAFEDLPEVMLSLPPAERVVGPPGESGRPGRDGTDGRDGIDGIGIKGDEGPPGRDGISIIATAINRDGELILTLSDGTLLTPGRVVPDVKRK
jgi:hypothetical protein